MTTTPSDQYHLRAVTSRNKVYKQWRNWRTGVIIESIHHPDEKTEIWWDSEFEAVVLFHLPEQHIVFCDPLLEVFKGEPRHTGCQIIRLDEFNRLKEEYGGENTHGKNYNRKKDNLTIEALISINIAIRREWLSASRLKEH